MSNVNIARAVQNIRSGTSIYTPLVEAIVNGIDAVEAAGVPNGFVEVSIHRSEQRELDDSLPEITGFTVRDNGIGFTEVNRTAFDTLYTTLKLAQGGKGFGRFTFLKYFSDVRIESVFLDDSIPKVRTFRMGRNTELIVDETVRPASSNAVGTTVRLVDVTQTFPDKSLSTVGRSIVEKLLPFFVSESQRCPRILLQEADGSERMVLNDYIGAPGDPLIVEVHSARGDFELEGVAGRMLFGARVFKLYSPKIRRSRVSLVAHRREVTTTSLHQYIPEFAEEFYDEISIAGLPTPRNFVVAVYVFGDYLDKNVSVERSGFEFQKEADLLLGISQRDIEAKAAEYARGPVEGEVRQRQERKAERIREYVRDKAPWHAAAVREVDLAAVPYAATEVEIDAHLHHIKHTREVKARREVDALLASDRQEDLQSRAADIVRLISESSRSELVHYVALRRSVLDILSRSLETDHQGKYRSEHTVHDVIFPRRGDIDHTAFDEHNLWIIDERLNFTEYLSSDVPLTEMGSDRPDLIAFGRRIGFRGGNEPSNPVVIFEFKRPGRDDFANPSYTEDPVEQIIRYVRQIREGKYRTPKGREIRIADNTPFYGYVVCDLTSKIRGWVEEAKDFKPMPDGLGFFRWHGSLNLYLEVLGWEKVRNDAMERNRVFFHKLGIV